MNKNTILLIAAGVGAYLLIRHLRKSGGVDGLGRWIPPCKTGPDCDAFKRQAEIYRAKGDRIKDAGYAELAKKFYALADQATKKTSGCCGPGESPAERQKKWDEEREKYRMTPEELEKEKDQIEINYEKVRQTYQKMIDEGKSYHGMTPAQLRKWIADIPKKIAEKVKELERNPYKPQYGLFSRGQETGGISPTLKVAPAASLDFSIDEDKSKPASISGQGAPSIAPAVMTDPDYYRKAWARENPGKPFPGMRPGGMGVKSPDTTVTNPQSALRKATTTSSSPSHMLATF